MAINIHTTEDQRRLAGKIIKVFEIEPGEKGKEDARKPRDVSDGVATIGYGYTLIRTDGNGGYFRTSTLEADMAAIGISALSPEELGGLDDIITVLNSGQSTGQAIKDKINAYGKDTWENPLTDEQMEKLLGIEVERREIVVAARFRKLLGKENGEALYAALSSSREMAGLLSLAYNAESLIGKGLARALHDGNRAQAWYEIRYASNGGKAGLRPGLAKRRFAESQLTGLYAGGARSRQRKGSAGCLPDASGAQEKHLAVRGRTGCAAQRQRGHPEHDLSGQQ